MEVRGKFPEGLTMTQFSSFPQNSVKSAISLGAQRRARHLIGPQAPCPSLVTLWISDKQSLIRKKEVSVFSCSGFTGICGGLLSVHNLIYNIVYMNFCTYHILYFLNHRHKFYFCKPANSLYNKT